MKRKKKNKDFKYMVGVVPYYGDGHIPKTKNVIKSSKYMSLKDARRKGENIFNKTPPKPMSDDAVMIFKKKKGKYKPHSNYYKYKGKKGWERVSTVEDLREGTG